MSVPPLAPIQPAPGEFNRLVLLRELIDTMTALVGPPQAYPAAAQSTAVLPDGRPVSSIVDLAQPARFAEAAAESARQISLNVAALGSDDGGDAGRAKTIWEETLAQIARVQSLYGYKPLPFQQQSSPSPATTPGA